MTTRTLLAPSLLFAAASALAAGFRAAPRLSFPVVDAVRAATGGCPS